jgi:hypothetical protein
MHPIAQQILGLLNDDIVSHGWVAQCARQYCGDEGELEIEAILAELLISGDVELGVAKLAPPDYVEFIAWKGALGERIARAMRAVDDAADRDREFSYWLCLRDNIDRFEDEST